MLYQTILADVPWRFSPRSVTSISRHSISRHYQTMHLDDIKALPIGDPAAKDCALFLWIIDTHLPESLEVIKAWGFKFRTVAFTWAKTNPKSGGIFCGLGWWTRSNCEHVLL